MTDEYAFEQFKTYVEFEGLLAKNEPVLLCAYGAGCSICTSAVAEAAIATAYGKSVTLVKMSVDSVPELVANLGIDTIPTLLLFPKDRAKQGTGAGLGARGRKFPSNPDAGGKNVLRWLADELRSEPTPGQRAVPEHLSSGLVAGGLKDEDAISLTRTLGCDAGAVDQASARQTPPDTVSA